jgi:protoheme IX farnesyltransferase
VSVALAPVRARRLALAWLELTKPRIATLVVITGVPALLLAADGMPAPRIFWGALLGTLLAAGSAASFNMYFDRDLDGLMRRTASRPLPAGILPPSAALGLGFALGALAITILLLATNALAATIGAASIAYYALLYTVWLKRRTPQNIVIGGGAGASAPLIAWAAVTGEVGVAAVLLAAIVFFWTPPHFWSLALYRRDDYERAGIPMLPVTHGEPMTRRHILAYTLVLVPVSLAAWPMGVTGAVYGVPATLLGGAFIALAVRLWRRRGTANAVGLFRFSILYLFALFALITLDVVVRAVLRG